MKRNIFLGSMLLAMAIFCYIEEQQRNISSASTDKKIDLFEGKVSRLSMGWTGKLFELQLTEEGRWRQKDSPVVVDEDVVSIYLKGLQGIFIKEKVPFDIVEGGVSAVGHIFEVNISAEGGFRRWVFGRRTPLGLSRYLYQDGSETLYIVSEAVYLSLAKKSRHFSSRRTNIIRKKRL